MARNARRRARLDSEAGRLLLLTLLLAGCGRGGPAREEAGLPPVVESPPEPATEISTGMPNPLPASPAPGTGALAGEQVAKVIVTDEGVTVTPNRLVPGVALFQVTNQASGPQEVEIDGPGEDGDLDEMRPGETRELRMTLQQGEYRVKASNEEGPDHPRSAPLAVVP